MEEAIDQILMKIFANYLPKHHLFQLWWVIPLAYCRNPEIYHYITMSQVGAGKDKNDGVIMDPYYHTTLRLTFLRDYPSLLDTLCTALQSKPAHVVDCI